MRHVAILASLLLFAACSKREPQETRVHLNADDSGEAVASPTAFINKVWTVKQSSSVAPGALYVFLSDGTLLITSPTSKPALGTWTHKDGTFTMMEEDIGYKVDILKLTDTEFKIRSHNPGEPVEITFGPVGQHPQ